MMGSLPGVGAEIERPQRLIQHTETYCIGTTPVTQAQWSVIGDCSELEPIGRVKKNPSKFQGSPRSQRLPVENVSWFEATSWASSLTELLSLTPSKHLCWSRTLPSTPIVRLPTSAEWERACRAGTQSRWWNGNNLRRAMDIGWFDQNSEKITHECGAKPPNPWGIYDTHGNVSEWCGDSFSDVVDGAVEAGALGAEDKILRGGNFRSSPEDGRSASLLASPPAQKSARYGFRLVLDWNK
jgi:formylglycine-generating enzyme required for sulfatase activity